MSNSTTLRSEFHVKSFSNRSFIIAIKSVLFIFLMITTVQLHAQESSKYVMYQNSYSAFNPGYTGLQSKYFASLSSNFPGKGRFSFPNTKKPYFNAETVIYEQKLEKLSSGIGANISYENIADVYCDLTFAVNYAYHIELDDFGTIGVGISVGRIFRTYKDLNDFNLNNLNDFRTFDTTGAKTYLSIGLAYKFRNLNFGAAIGEMYPVAPAKNPNWFFARPNYAVNVNASYDVKLSGKHTLIPSIYVAALPDDMLRIDYKLMFDYKKRIWGAATFLDLRRVRGKESSLYLSKSSLYLSIGTDIQGKYRIGYTFSRDESLFGSPSEYHELVLAWMLK